MTTSLSRKLRLALKAERGEHRGGWDPWRNERLGIVHVPAERVGRLAGRLFAERAARYDAQQICGGGAVSDRVATPIHLCNEASQPAIRIVCTQEWVYPWTQAPDLPDGVHDAEGDWYTFDRLKVTCAACASADQERLEQARAGRRTADAQQPDRKVGGR